MIDEYGVELVVNADYAAKNNLHSIKLVKEHLENAYIIPCDIWCDRNPFHRHELYSWYMVSDMVVNESNVRVNRKMELVTVPESSGGNAMIGICYLVKEDADTVAKCIEELCKISGMMEHSGRKLFIKGSDDSTSSRGSFSRCSGNQYL